MNTPNDNPYPNSSPTPGSNPDADKGTVLAGFFIGWGLMIGGGMISGFVISILSAVVNAIGGYDSLMFQGLGLLSLLLPVAILIAGMLWFYKKGKTKIVKGIVAAVISSIAIVVLLVAACFGLFALGGSNFH